jgi:nitrogen-specific signal transduction histidine kinase
LRRVEADRARVALVADSNARLPDVWIDPQQIEQVLLNVVLNAIQASPPGACVRVGESLDHEATVLAGRGESQARPASRHCPASVKLPSPSGYRLAH